MSEDVAGRTRVGRSQQKYPLVVTKCQWPARRLACGAIFYDWALDGREVIGYWMQPYLPPNAGNLSSPPPSDPYNLVLAHCHHDRNAAQVCLRLLREKKIARNEARLEELGLHDVKKKLATSARKTTTKRRPKRRAQPAAPTRTSRRQSKKPVQFQPLMDDDEDTRRARQKFKAVKKRTKAANMKFKCEVPANLSAALTAKQKKAMEKKMDCDWLEMFEVSWRFSIACFVSHDPPVLTIYISSLQIIFNKCRTI